MSQNPMTPDPARHEQAPDRLAGDRVELEDPELDDSFLDDDEPTQDEIRGMHSALTRYRIFAYTTGVLLVLLVCVAVPMKYLAHDDRMVTWTGLPHGWLYMFLLMTAFDLGRRARWSWQRLVLIALAGTVPFLSFVAEHSARKDVLAKIAAAEAKLPRSL